MNRSSLTLALTLTLFLAAPALAQQRGFTPEDYYDIVGVGGLATSATTRRQWNVAGRPANHLIDPRTLSPAFSPIFSATVMTETAVEAEAGAKAVLLHGEHGLAWAEQQQWIDAALVVWRDGSVYATTGWEQAA